MDTRHIDGRRFRNPSGADGQPFWKVPRLLLAPRTRWPARVPVRPQKPPPLEPTDAAVITFIGHATFLIQTAAGNILTDPVYAERASPFQSIGPRRVREPGVAFDDLPPIAVILLSHNHYDHCDLRTLLTLDRRYDPVVVTPLKNRALLESVGVRRVEELDWWGQSSMTPMPVTLGPAQHFSARGPFDRNRSLWGSFIMSTNGQHILFGGDSGYGSHFCDIRRRVGSVQLALLPIGAYEPRWFMKDVHMNPAEAVQAHVDVGSEQSIGMHFGTFQLTSEGIDEPVTALAEALRARNVPRDRFRTLEVGESFRLARR